VSNKPVIRLIDLSAIAMPIWSVLKGKPEESRTADEIVAKVEGLSANYPHTAVCCDSGRSFRHDIDPSYKANRPEKDPAYITHYRNAAIALDRRGYPIWDCKGFEADDVIATATSAARGHGHPVEIVGIDKDLQALVTDEDPCVAFVDFRNHRRLASAEVTAERGVFPAQIPDFLTLAGDDSDGIPGVRGIGKVGAAKLLARFGSVANIYRQLSSGASMGIPPNVHAALSAAADSIPRIQKLVEMNTAAPVPFAEVLKPRASVSQTEEATFVDLVQATAEVADDNDRQRATNRENSQRAESYQLADKPAAPEQGAGEDRKPPSMVKEAAALVPAVQAVLVPEVVYERQLEPRDLRAAAFAAEQLHRSGFLSVSNGQAVLAKAMAGRDFKLSMMASQRAFHVIENKLSMAADAIRAIVLASPHCEYFRCIERTPERATFATKRKGDPEVTLTYTTGEAKASGLAGWNGSEFKAGSGWAKSPADQCVARASAKLARLVYADVVFGLYDPSELEQ
jgi:5'-3' exonuclease